MKIYLAPMEGLTGYVFRNAYKQCFDQVDRYFTPFLSNRGLNRRELNDVLPEHNQGMDVIPQILTDKTDVFLELAGQMKDFGYREVNLNLGCPSGTVTAKGRGSGFLREPKRLERFLDEIFESCDLKISIKTRIGSDSTDEWPTLQQIYEKYPMTELIIHPRIMKDFYRNVPRLSVYAMADEGSRQSLCYNGDILSKQGYEAVAQQFPNTEKFMLGRGLLTNPGLAGEIHGEAPVTDEKLEKFLNLLLEGYCHELTGEEPVLRKMKELWSYLGRSFDQAEKQLKQMKKATKIREYELVVKTILRSCERKQLT
ncbi:MAG: tRNA-dihydrouridine synthase family protein [Lachnospiraceae bacterium]|nr:tRNA-dihydrouridine synthase family protein [Lachnospiraceae bacterium]